MQHSVSFLNSSLFLQEIHFKEDKERRRHANIQELVTAKENEKQLGKEVEHLKEQLRMERKRHKDAMEKVLILLFMNLFCAFLFCEGIYINEQYLLLFFPLFNVFGIN